MMIMKKNNQKDKCLLKAHPTPAVFICWALYTCSLDQTLKVLRTFSLFRAAFSTLKLWPKFYLKKRRFLVNIWFPVWKHSPSTSIPRPSTDHLCGFSCWGSVRKSCCWLGAENSNALKEIKELVWGGKVMFWGTKEKPRTAQGFGVSSDCCW